MRWFIHEYKLLFIFPCGPILNTTSWGWWPSWISTSQKKCQLCDHAWYSLGSIMFVVSKTKEFIHFPIGFYDKNKTTLGKDLARIIIFDFNWLSNFWKDNLWNLGSVYTRGTAVLVNKNIQLLWYILWYVSLNYFWNATFCINDNKRTTCTLSVWMCNKSAAAPFYSHRRKLSMLEFKYFEI